MKFLVIVACHNRKMLTIQSIQRAQAAAEEAGIEISFTVFDDASTDGTGEALRSMPIALQVLRGDGSAFWAKGMAAAESEALENAAGGSDEFILWLNDDVVLDDDAFVRLRRSIDRNPRAVVVGAMRDPQNGEVTYSGMRRHGMHPLSFRMVSPGLSQTKVDTFNGNLVIVPVLVARRLGGIDGVFSHALADIDYGLRCLRLNVPVVLASSTYGTCPRNPIGPRRRALDDWRAFTGAKGGGNYASLKRILIKSNRRSWRMFILATYALWWIRRVGSADFSIKPTR